ALSLLSPCAWKIGPLLIATALEHISGIPKLFESTVPSWFWIAERFARSRFVNELSAARTRRCWLPRPLRVPIQRRVSSQIASFVARSVENGPVLAPASILCTLFISG